MPKMAVIHIQKIAPGPPSVMAVATPARLPVPTWPDSAVESACQGVMAPSSPCALRPAQTSATAGPNLRSGRAPTRYIMNRPVPSSTMASGPIWNGKMTVSPQVPPQIRPDTF